MQKDSRLNSGVEQSRAAITASFMANIAIAISKFAAFLITGSTAMLAEAAHSVVDSSNQVLLFIGIHQSRRQPSNTHPFGHGRAHYLYAFMVPIVLFSLGALFAIYEGVHKIIAPEPINYPLVAYAVLILAALFEGLALRKALHEASTFKPAAQSWWQFLIQTKSVNHVVLAFEDSSALVGLSMAAIGITLALVTGNPVWDGVGTLCIAALLIVVAAVLFKEIKSLIIGEAVDPETYNKMRSIILKSKGVVDIIDLKTIYTGPQELFVAMEIIVDANDSASKVERTIDEIEVRIREVFPIARLIYIEPDLRHTVREQRKHDKAVERDSQN